MHILPALFGTFAKVGLFTFGGGYAMLALIEDACVGKRQWISHDEMMDMTVVAESTPGPIAINCATYVGWRQAGIMGAVAATAGIVLPSFLIIFFLAGFLKNWLKIPWVAHAFQGIRLAVALLILDAGGAMLKRMPKKTLPLGVMAASFMIPLTGALAGVHVSSVLLMVASGIFSLAYFSVTRYRKKGGGK